MNLLLRCPTGRSVRSRCRNLFEGNALLGFRILASAIRSRRNLNRRTARIHHDRFGLTPVRAGIDVKGKRSDKKDRSKKRCQLDQQPASTCAAEDGLAASAEDHTHSFLARLKQDQDDDRHAGEYMYSNDESCQLFFPVIFTDMAASSLSCHNRRKALSVKACATYQHTVDIVNP